jgi:hypothetical protein
LEIYINSFHAPIYRNEYYDVSRDNEKDVIYPAFRISQAFSKNWHDGVDITFLPVDGLSNRASVPFPVYAPYSGWVIETGPDGTGGTQYFTGVYKNFPSWVKDACPLSTEPCYPNGYFTWFTYNKPDPVPTGQGTPTVTPEPLSVDTSVFTLMVAIPPLWLIDNRNIDPKQVNTNAPSPQNTITEREYNTLFTLVSEQKLSIGCGEVFGCSEGPGRQLIIWYKVDDDPLPDIATVFYHVGIELEQYNVWQANCSVLAVSQDPNRLAVWNTVASVGSICEISQGQYLGIAGPFGFTTGEHVHYGVFIDPDNLNTDVDNNNVFIESPNQTDDIDPLTAIDFHMQPCEDTGLCTGGRGS